MLLFSILGARRGIYILINLGAEKTWFRKNEISNFNKQNLATLLCISICNIFGFKGMCPDEKATWIILMNALGKCKAWLLHIWS